MSKLRKTFDRDILFLSKNEVPLEPSGEKVSNLKYGGSDDERLEDDDVYALSEALMNNTEYCGPLDLSKNNLTDLVSYIIFI